MLPVYFTLYCGIHETLWL